jgi:hypothetical protein
VSAALHARRKQLLARQAIRAWEYRQRGAAKGVWPRLRRLLAGSELAAIVEAETAEALVAEGLVPEPVGGELDPPPTNQVLPRARFERLEGGRPISVALSAEVLAARYLVLVPFAIDVRG